MVTPFSLSTSGSPGLRIEAGALVAVLLMACASAPGRERVPSRLEGHGDRAEVVVPDTVARGQVFEVRVTTMAGGCRRESAGTDVRTAGTVADIRPYEWLVRTQACTDDLVFIPHTAQVRFDQPGVATVRVHGVSNRLDFGEAPQWTVLERRVVVR